MDDVVRIVHISDLHFGGEGQRVVWASLCEYIRSTIRPHLVLITGDIVDSPDQKKYKEAKAEIDKLAHVEGHDCSIRVCPGNHDRHVLGIAPGKRGHRFWRSVQPPGTVPAWFDNNFSELIAPIKDPRDLPLAAGENEWRVRVLGVDSSAEARYSAQGFLSADVLSNVRQSAVKGSENCDLVILLQHHHLLPIKGEEKIDVRAQSPLDLIQPTIMLNSGTVLDTLAESHVNIVLHGHKHKRAVSKYGNMDGRQGELIVLGAGSATGMWEPGGNELKRRCDSDHASCNLLELTLDRCVYLREIRHNSKTWEYGKATEILLLDSRAIRRARFFRRQRAAKTPTKQIIRCVEFHTNRDITLSDSFINFDFRARSEWRRRTTNSTGVPIVAEVTVEDEVTVEHEGKVKAEWKVKRIADVTIYETGEYDTYQIVADLEKSKCRAPRNLKMQVKWLSGALLTTRDFETIEMSRAGSYRADDHEFAAIDVPEPELESVTLLVRLPTMFAPDPGSIKVFIEGRDHRDRKLDRALTASIRHFSAGVFSIEVPYPVPDSCYVLAWPPVSVATVSDQAKRFGSVAKISEKAEKLLRIVTDSVSGRSYYGNASYGLYVPRGPKDLLLCASSLLPETSAVHRHLPSELSIANHVALHRLAWWGDVQIAKAVDGNALTEGERAKGFVDGEHALIVVPVRQFRDRGHEACAIVRIGIRADDVIRADKVDLEAEKEFLVRVVFQMLEDARKLE